MQTLKEIAKDVKEISEELNIQVILSSGSLLGAYRDKGIIEGDEDDIDFVVPFKVMQRKGTLLYKAFLRRGYKLHRLRDTVISFKKNECSVDFIFFKEWDFTFHYETLYHEKRPFALLIPKRFLQNLSEIEFLGQKFKCPVDIEGYLEWKYGDWRVPVLRPAFSFQNLIDKGITHYLDE